MKPRRIFFATTDWLTAETFLSRQLQYFSTAGWDVHLGCANIPAQFDSGGTFSDITVHEIFMKRNPSPMADIWSLALWVTVLREVRPDVFVGSTPKASLLGLLAATSQRIRARVYWVHGLRFEAESGLFRLILLNLERATIYLATNVLTVSGSLRASLIREIPASVGKAPAPSRYHASGIRADRFAPPTALQVREAREMFGLPESSLLVGFAGRLNADKGLRYLLEAMEEVVRQIPNALLLIAGGRDESNPISAVEMQALEADHVRNLGIQSDMASFYRSLDVFCMPSIREGLSTVNLEAAASGLPVVTTSATGCVDSILPGKTGLLVPPRDSQALVQAIICFLRNAGERHEKGMSGSLWVRENFAESDVWESNLKFFDSV